MDDTETPLSPLEHLLRFVLFLPFLLPLSVLFGFDDFCQTTGRAPGMRHAAMFLACFLGFFIFFIVGALRLRAMGQGLTSWRLDLLLIVAAGSLAWLAQAPLASLFVHVLSPKYLCVFWMS